MNKRMKKCLACFLSFMLLFTVVLPAVSAAAVGNTRTAQLIAVDPSKLNVPKLGETDAAEEPTEEISIGLNDVVRVSVFLDEPSARDAGYAIQGVSANREAVAYQETLRRNQNAMQAKIEAATGSAINVKWNLTLLTNAISAEVRYGDLDAIRAIPGVKSVEIERQYAPAETVEGDAASPNMTNARDMVGANTGNATKYTGAGSRLAVIDTGLDTAHQSFDADAFDYAIAEDEAVNGVTYDLLTSQKVSDHKAQLNGKNGVYISSKIPFAYNYVDKNTTVNHESDTQEEHGSHVAGITSANRYLKSGNDFVSAADAVKVVGEAPDAQIMVMKVFGSGGGAYDSDYFAAVEDAVRLGASSANLSLGSSLPGIATETSSSYLTILNNLESSELVMSVSMGNNTSWDSQKQLYADDVNLMTGGSPGSFNNTLTVASIDDTGAFAPYILFNNTLELRYMEGGGAADNAPITTIAGEYRYVYVDGVGTAAQFGAVADELNGAVALCNRGETSFYEKANAAVEAGAVALIVVNNQAGTISMALDGYSYTNPVVSIKQAEGVELKAISEQKTAGSVTYYTGKIKIGGEDDKTRMAYYEMSSFSSWGVPGALTLKPEITAPGGSVLSLNGYHRNASGGGYSGGHDQYELMSGTSMAAPQITGLVAAIGQYYRENNIANRTGLTARQFAQSMLMSTAIPVLEAESGYYYSLLKQGAGLANLENVVDAKSYIKMDAAATMAADDYKIKAELGDDPARNGVYTYAFEIHNFSDVDVSYTLRTDVFTQALSADKTLMEHTTEALDATVTYDVGSALTVAAGGSAKVTATITLSEAQKATLNAERVGGAYLEAYTFIESENDVTYSIPVLGFYGSWTDASMFDAANYAEDVYYTSGQTSYFGASNTNQVLIRYNGSTTNTAFVGNPYVKEAAFPVDRLALNNSANIYQIRYNLIRPAAGLAFAAVDENGSVLYAANPSQNQNATYFNTQATNPSWQNTSVLSSTTNRTVSSLGLAENAKFTFGLFAFPEYYTYQANGNDQTFALTSAQFQKILKDGNYGKGAYIGYTVTVDNTAPTLDAPVINEDGTVTLNFSDNQYIANLRLMDVSGRNTYLSIVPEQNEAGAALTFTFDPADYTTGNAITVFVADYAGNETAGLVRIADGPIVVERAVYRLTNTLEADKNYLIVNANTVGTRYALSHSGTTKGRATVTVVNDNGVMTIEEADAAAVFTAAVNGSGFSLNNGGYYLAATRNNVSFSANAPAATAYFTFDGTNNRLGYRNGNSTYYVRYNNNAFTGSTTAYSVYLFGEEFVTETIDPDAVSTVNVTPATASLYTGNTLDLQVEVLPVTAVDKSVTFTSSDETVATVDENGHVVAVGGGTATITVASVSNPDATGTCVVTVTAVTPMNATVNAQLVNDAGANFVKIDLSNGSAEILGAAAGTHYGGGRSDDVIIGFQSDGNIVETDIYDDGYDSYILGSFGTTQYNARDGAHIPNVSYSFSDLSADVNADGVTDENDVSAILAYVSGENDGAAYNLTVADLDADESITSRDAYVLLEKLAAGPTVITEEYLSIFFASSYLLMFTPDYSITGWNLSGYTAIAYAGTDPETGDHYYYALNSSGQLVTLMIGVDTEEPIAVDEETGEESLSLVLSTGTATAISGLSTSAGTFGANYMSMSVLDTEDYYGLLIANSNNRRIYFVDLTADTLSATLVAGFTGATSLTTLYNDDYDTSVVSIAAAKNIARMKADVAANGVSVGKAENLGKISREPANAAGTLNAVDVTVSDGNVVEVTVTEDEALNNGVYTLTWDVETMRLADLSTSATYYSAIAANGRATVALADLPAIEAGSAVVTFRFNVLSCEDVAAALGTLERNAELGLTESEDVPLEGIGHDWTFVDFTWTGDDENGYTAAVANYVCANDETHTATAQAGISVETTSATSAAAGQIVYIATVPAEDSLDGEAHTDEKIVEIEQLEPDYEFIGFEWSEDHQTAVAVFVDHNNNDEVIEIEADVTVDTTPATSAAAGESVYTAVVVGPDGETYTETCTEVLEQLEPDYEFVGFEWTEDGSAVAVFVDHNNNDERIEVEADVTVDTTPATSSAEGETVYTAVAVGPDGETYTDTYTVVIEKLEPDYEVTFGWSEDYSSAIAIIVDHNDPGAEPVIVDADVTEETTPATYSEDGETVYTATVEYNGYTFTDQKSVVIPCEGSLAGGPCPYCGEYHDPSTLSGWWTELVHHILYILNRIFLWWSPIAK